jgi:pimeloyl-ACP methyl ester carboxylesterase
MNQTPSCIYDCPLACADVCAAHPPDGLPPIDVAEARARFEREAVRGTCDTCRYRMPYYSWGSGPPLVFIHGLGDSSHSFLLPIARLSAHFRCIAYEQPAGKGDGACLKRYSHDHLAADVFALLDHLGLARSYVLASSFGATIALKALADRPERLPRAILQGALAHRPLRRAERWVAWLARFLPGRAAWLPLREKLLRAANPELYEGRPPDVWRYFVECSGRVRIAAIACQGRLLHRLDLRPLLPRVRQPVLLVCGDRDRVVPPPCTEVLLHGLPSAGRVVLEGCGHVPSYSHPEVYAEVVRQFLTPATPGERGVSTPCFPQRTTGG